ncbi:hypothetical protein DFJ67_5546 [Asanoa ferruginea]|uniref:Nucleotidyltransferase-like protein n=1 Tax=Asanoa ferruginea TaxID=53367 RepID=A0A3D9ZQR3_9ACTN|nr:hypothetical protein [Asanoa ferruginea]REF99507.1 hypothetical protein DFJ67_5546 [Asanoa ferruginea]GIF49444.1 hypothetical protein Afe04nite_39830 [Asanoa ferruginea]
MTLPPAVSDFFLSEIDDRLPGRVAGLFLHGSLCWGEFFAGSDVDFVGLWEELPTGADLALLRAAHEATKVRFPSLVFDGFHCTSADLAAAPALVGRRPVFYQGEFAAAGTIDINLVTWHELAERGITVRGELPPVFTDLAALLEFTRNNLDTFWRGIAKQVDDAGPTVFGGHDASVAFVGLGPARLHHLLTTGTLTSKSGAGRYVRDSLDQRWNLIARESLRLREDPGSASLYDDPARRGRDAGGLLRWLIDDGCRDRAGGSARRIDAAARHQGDPA